ncbi:MAG: hypothetical protein A2Y62_22265 [Candidatus Fischerbacteria bacterium RBG_13_37_8]|uniref:RNA polymerase subunit sigma-24 n=1 Tax=Candidatus Fischerbacteria bacterium RBG_13_37_8 TaxID=1817863 RepID=A0A1F5VJE0_9BACT|nr:MAG: hypothetical protein A2Y62_22265 [Candidatus Fischerbacteria bacterium RBG_13_37_8]
MSTDANLLTMGADGDEEAWQELVKKYTSIVLNICFQYTGNTHLAEELSQDVFIKVYKNACVLAKHPNFKWWLIKTTKNRCIDYYRKARAEKLKVSTDKVAAKLVAHDTPERVVLFSERVQLLHKAILKLPASLRTLIILRDINELSYEEISRMLKIPLGTVKSKLNRARVELFKIFGTFKELKS